MRWTMSWYLASTLVSSPMYSMPFGSQQSASPLSWIYRLYLISGTCLSGGILCLLLKLFSILFVCFMTGPACFVSRVDGDMFGGCTDRCRMPALETRDGNRVGRSTRTDPDNQCKIETELFAGPTLCCPKLFQKFSRWKIQTVCCVRGKYKATFISRSVRSVYLL